MKGWALLYPDLLVHLPGVSDPLLDQEIRRVAADYFRRTRSWVEWLPAVTTDADAREYSLDKPSGTDVVALERATMDGNPIEILSWRELPADPSSEAGGVAGISSRDRLDFIVDKTVADGQSLAVLVSLAPSRLSSGLPDDLFEQHFETITRGVLARVMLFPGQTFSNPQLAAVHRQDYEAALASATVHAWRGQTNVTPRRRVHWA